jgi:hypothetical protein
MVRAGRAAFSEGGANDQRHFDAAAGNIVDLSRLVHTWLMASAMKSANMRSTTGCIPAMAAPIPSPVKPSSEMGVSRTRPSPNSACSPLVCLKLPPRGPIPSPI